MAPTFSSDESSETIELQQQVIRLQALLETSRQIHGTIKLDEVLTTILRIVVRELEMEGALIESPRMQYGTMPEEPWTGCARFPLTDRAGRDLTTLLVSTPEGRDLTLYEQDFLEGLAIQAASAVENARYHEKSLGWARVEQDLDAARAIQRSLLPQAAPDIAGYSIGFRSSACYEVGGDYLDIFALPTGEQIMVVADVAGKGLASAIVSVAFRSAFRAMAATVGGSLSELAARISQQHWNEGQESRRRYVTAIFLKLDPAAHRLEILNAGHNDGFLVSPDGNTRAVEASGPPLGILPGTRYTSETFDFEEGTRLLFYTDGLTEVFRPDDEEFGPERLLQHFRQCVEPDSALMLESVWQALADFAGEIKQQDDMTALALHRIPAAREAAA